MVIYIRRRFCFSLNDQEYDADIDSCLNTMYRFCKVRLVQAPYQDMNDDSYIFHIKNIAFHFRVTEINGNTQIIGDIDNINCLHLVVDKHKNTADYLYLKVNIIHINLNYNQLFIILLLKSRIFIINT